MELVNLTPHAVNIVDDNGNALKTIEPSGKVARVSMSREVVDHINGIPVNRAVTGEPTDLPDPVRGTTLIVSRIVAEACKVRHDLVVPDETVRDDKGRIVGCKALATVSDSRNEYYYCRACGLTTEHKPVTGRCLECGEDDSYTGPCA
jgi:hypothetical protein